MAPEVETTVAKRTAFWFSAFLLKIKGLTTFFFYINQIVSEDIGYKKASMRNFDNFTPQIESNCFGFLHFFRKRKLLMALNVS